MPSWNSLNFQDMSSINIIELIILHDYVIIVILSILLLILYILIILIVSKLVYKTFSESTFVETIWSLIPALMLLFLILPSIKVLYIVEDLKTPSISFKIIAHQWYWSFICPLFINIFFTFNNKIISRIELDSIITNKTPRLLANTSRILIPSNTASRILVTSTDVIHSFTIPRLGLKVDALPGRLNQLFTIPIRIGTYFGQCSEICGSNHSFIPIRFQVCTTPLFNKNMLINTLESLNLGKSFINLILSKLRIKSNPSTNHTYILKINSYFNFFFLYLLISLFF